MGTRADFYVGRGEKAEWLGSIAWDGYPDGITKSVLRARSEEEYRLRLAAFFKRREDVTLPERGWPWPWNDSTTTDYAYAFDGGEVHGSCFGGPWFVARYSQPEEENETGPKATFPDMTKRTNVAHGGPRSGLIVIQSK